MKGQVRFLAQNMDQIVYTDCFSRYEETSVVIKLYLY
jgi:hypothetical protein